MTMARRMMVGVGGLVVLLLVAGCQNPDALRIQALQEQIAKLQQENDDLRSRLAQAISERDQARNRVAALERENADLRSQLAAKPPAVELPDDWKRSGPYAWTELSTDFLFDSGKATLRPAARAKLQQVVNDINARFPTDAIWVLGHTDTDPIKQTKNLWTDNLDLSCNRGMTVYRELMNLGISPGRMMAGGQGEYFPITTNSTRAGKQQNRRVEIIAVPPRGAPETGGTVTPSDSTTP